MESFAVIAIFILGFGLFSGKLQKSIITPPMVFVIFGMLISPRVLGIVELELDDELVRLLAEFTLVLVLFTDALRIELRLLRRQYNMPIRLLAVGMPLTLLAGIGVGLAIFTELEFWEVAVLAAVLTPTDAALGQVVISSPRVPARIRQTLNVESGLNDGIAAPLVVILLSFATAAENPGTLGMWTEFTAKQLIFGPLVGVLVGYLGGQLVLRATRIKWMSHSFEQLAALALALFAFSLAELIGGNGFIAAFVAGLTIGNTAREIWSDLYEFAEAEGQLLTLLTFMSFGAVMVWPALDIVDSRMILYAVLSLTVVRIIPVTLALLGLGLRWTTIGFLGWFGPRGIASVLFALIVLERELNDGALIFAIAMITILISVFAHGLTALPGAIWYATHAEKMPDAPHPPELQPIKEMRLRIPHLD